MEKKTGSYGWTPQQMERVNARRQARGQEQLLNANTGNQESSDDYNKYYGEVQKKSNKPVRITKSKYDLEKEAASKTPLSQRIKESGTSFKSKQEEDQSTFREKFRKKQMLPHGMGGMKSGISSPSTRQGYTMIG
jgi:hypothetical protein